MESQSSRLIDLDRQSEVKIQPLLSPSTDFLNSYQFCYRQDAQFNGKGGLQSEKNHFLEGIKQIGDLQTFGSLRQIENYSSGIKSRVIENSKQERFNKSYKHLEETSQNNLYFRQGNVRNNNQEILFDEKNISRKVNASQITNYANKQQRQKAIKSPQTFERNKRQQQGTKKNIQGKQSRGIYSIVEHIKTVKLMAQQSYEREVQDRQRKNSIATDCVLQNNMNNTSILQQYVQNTDLTEIKVPQLYLNDENYGNNICDNKELKKCSSDSSIIRVIQSINKQQKSSTNNPIKYSQQNNQKKNQVQNFPSKDSFDYLTNMGSRSQMIAYGKQQINEHIQGSDEYSCGSEKKEQRNYIWQQEYFQLQDHQLKNLQQKQTQSQNQSKSISRSSTSFQKEGRYPQQSERENLIKENYIMRMELDEIKCQIMLLKEEKVNFEQQKSSMEILKLTNSDKMCELLQQNRELNNIVQEYKEKIFNDQILLRKYEYSVSTLQKELHNYGLKIQQKQKQVSELQNLLLQVKFDHDQMIIVNQQMEDVIKSKSIQYQQKLKLMQNQVLSLNEIIDFYKQKFNSEGVVLNIEDIKYIKEVIQIQQNQQHENIKKVQKVYKKALQDIMQQNENYANALKDLKQQKQSSKFHHKEMTKMGLQFQQVIRQYDKQLELRDEQILRLKKEISKHRQYEEQFNSNNCKTYICHINNVSRLLDSYQKMNPSQVQLQLGYVMDRLLKINELLQKQNKNLHQQKNHLFNLVKKTEHNYKQQLQRAKKQINQMKNENQSLSKLTKKVQFLSSLRMNSEKDNGLLLHKALTSFLQTENSRLKQKLKKLKVYCHKLETKMILGGGILKGDISTQIVSDEIQNQHFKDIFLTHYRQFQQAELSADNQYKTIIQKLTVNLEESPKKIKIKTQKCSKKVSLKSSPARPSLDNSFSQPLKCILDQNKLKYQEKIHLTQKLVQFTEMRLKANKKVTSFNIGEVNVRFIDGTLDIELSLQKGNEGEKQRQDEDQKDLLYSAPQVLLGFAQSQQSYVWTIGIIIDQIFHNGVFYKKIGQIKSRADNYYCRDSKLPIKSVLQSMLKKNHRERKGIDVIKRQINLELAVHGLKQ